MKSGAVWIERRSVRKGPVNKLIAASNLARGESEAIVLCQELNADLLVVDDDDARKYAIEQKIPIIGTAGILVLAKQNGLITEVRQLLEQLLARGFYMSRASFQTILRAAGEN